MNIFCFLKNVYLCNVNYLIMKAKVIKTGEIVDVYYHGVPSYAVLDCNHLIKELYYEDELEFEPCSKMVSLDKVCEYLKTLKFQEYPGAPLQRLLDDSNINALRKEFE